MVSKFFLSLCFLLLPLVFVDCVGQGRPAGIVEEATFDSQNDAFKLHKAYGTGMFACSNGQKSAREATYRLSKPLIGDDGKVYTCSGKDLFAFQSNGSIVWMVALNYACNVDIAPVQEGSRKIYLVAENRLLKVNPLNIGTSEPTVEVFFGPETSAEGSDEIVGISVSTSSSCVLVSVRNRGLFAFRLHGQLLWTAGPVLYQSGYRQGCRRNLTYCYFSSVPVIDHCEASIYISNNEGELYALSTGSPHFKWIQDLSSFDKVFTVTPGNNGRLYVMMPFKALVLALDAFNGAILWQGSVGPVSTTEYSPVVDSKGWISIGSLDGFLYSFSPTGDLKKFQRLDTVNSVVQVSPVLDCSGYALYISQTEMEGKITHKIGDYTYISAMKPRKVVVSMHVPATGATYWSEIYPGSFSSFLSQTELQHFVVDERILLAFVAASKIGNPFPCRSTSQKLADSCSQVKPKRDIIYTGNEKAILLFLLFESAILIVLAGLVRFCFMFWRKKKLQDHGLGKFLAKRCSLRKQKRAFDRTITEFEKRTAEEEAVPNGVLDELGDMVKQREGIERKLSTAYSLGRDRVKSRSRSRSFLPLYDGKSKSHSFQGAKKESFTIFHTLSETSSGDSTNERETDTNSDEDRRCLAANQANAKATTHVEGETSIQCYSESESSTEGFMDPLCTKLALSEPEHMMRGRLSVMETVRSGSRSVRRRTLSLTNYKF